MPIIKSAAKRMRQDKKRHAKNLRVKRDLKSATKAFLAEPTFDGMKVVQSKLDTAVKKNILKKNTAARRMSQISATAKAAGVKISTSDKGAKTKSSPVAAKKVADKAAPKKPSSKATSNKPASKNKTVAKKA